MKILLVLKQKKNVETFIETIRALLDRGHSVTLAVQERSDEHDDVYRESIDSPRFSVVRCPAHRLDEWSEVAWLLRSLRDCVHYQLPPLRQAGKLQARAVHKLREELRIHADDATVAAALRDIPSQQIERLEAVYALAEQQLPTDALYDQFLRSQSPDLLLISPLVHFGSAQADFVASARAQGIPVGMLLYSWDNLSTKGCLHQPPDRLFVWNEGQRREAGALHGFPEDRVAVVGAPRFDAFFALRARTARDDFHASLGLDPGRPTLLYVCSSQFVSAGELSFVRKWLTSIRGSAFESLRHCNVIVRPHPDIALLGPEIPVHEVKWPATRGSKGLLSRPFDDPCAVVLRTSDRTQQGFYECLHHSAAVIGLNTSAELEAAIVGRPVFTILAGDDADGQGSTLHFRYLLEGEGGCVRVARSLEEHAGQVADALGSTSSADALRGFVTAFLRPHGIDRPVAPLLAEAIEREFRDLRATAPGVMAARERSHVAPPRTSLSESGTGRRRIVPLAIPKFGYEIRIQEPEVSGPAAENTINKTTAHWLRDHVAIGDIVYDVGAGIGVFSVIAAKYHGAAVVAFEPGYAAYADLCDNVRVNGCDGSVMAVPFGLADYEGMGELKYPEGKAGQGRHALRPATWRVRRASGDEGAFRQWACVTSLDRAIARYGLPAPAHLRLGSPSTVSSVLTGAFETLASSSVKTVLCTLAVEEGEALLTKLAPFKWVLAQQVPLSRGRAHMLLSRDTAPTASLVNTVTDTPRPPVGSEPS